MSDLHELSATQLLHAFRLGELSPVAVVHDVLAHIARWEPHLHATWALDLPTRAGGRLATLRRAGCGANRSAHWTVCRSR
jgi:Asp-tRNA(Asn)/Glu-tRNA(Gln) amidotransferase A subunit family amidase